ncbi:hypothetical protein BMS3Abin07_00005 [bacterium BMS3Abin07]|nr:hypothetical protein BMS3Abin07_00005 [bacterium BMS3Abin07]GBE31836.1 hypothetical protein BMS3Bbin05_00739 [bacterium BMS3Bbin05]
MFQDGLINNRILVFSFILLILSKIEISGSQILNIKYLAVYLVLFAWSMAQGGQATALPEQLRQVPVAIYPVTGIVCCRVDSKIPP